MAWPASVRRRECRNLALQLRQRHHVILGIGIDVVATGRIARAMAGFGQRFEERVFTRGELADCAERADRAEALAARFAAKEACLKALGTGAAEGLSFRQIEVVHEADGRPALNLTGAAAARASRQGVRATHVSLSHQPGLAAAVVILEG